MNSSKNRKYITIAITVIVTAGVFFLNQPLVTLTIDLLLFAGLLWLIQRMRKGIPNLGGYVFFVLMCLLFTVGQFIFTPTFDSDERLRIYALVFGALVTIAVYKDKKLSKTKPGALLIGIFIISTFWFTGQLMLLNVALDSSEPVSHDGNVAQMITSYGRITNDYVIYINFDQGTPNEEKYRQVNVSKRQYNNYKEGDKILVSIHHGFFGIEYFYLGQI